MSIAEILLLVLGAVIFAAGFIVPEMKDRSDTGLNIDEADQKLQETADRCVEEAKKKIADTVTAECSIAQDDVARAMEKLSNEKIMAINEYGKTVVDEIERNHKEVLFLYDMLNEKTADIKNTVRKVDSVSKTVPVPNAKDRPALKAAIAGGVGRNATASVTRHENEEKEERRAAYGVDEHVKTGAGSEGGDRGFKIPKIFAPKADEQKSDKGNVSTNYPDNLSEKIMELHENGVSDVDIARQFGIGVGEVRLKIGLMEARQE